MTDQQFLAAVWQKAAQLEWRENELRRALRESRALRRKAAQKTLAAGAGLLLLAGLLMALSALLPTGFIALSALGPAISLGLALYAEGRGNNTQRREDTANG